MTYIKAFSALSDNTRRALFEKIATRPDNVANLAEGFPVSRPAISQHLKILQDAKLVKAKPEGAKRIYQVDQQGLQAIKDYLGQFWGDALGAFAAEIHKQNRTQ